MRLASLIILIILTVAKNYAQKPKFEWAKGFTGTTYVNGVCIKTDNIGNVYTVGTFWGRVDFDPDSINIFNLSSEGNTDIFISKLDSSGNFIWAKRIGSIGEDNASSIAIDNLGNAYITGFFSDKADFDPNNGVFELTSFGLTDIFILKFDALGNFIWAKQFGGTQNDEASSLIIDKNRNIYSTGFFSGQADFNPDTSSISNLTSAGREDIFVLKLDSSGNLVWVKGMGGTYIDKGLSIALDLSGNVYSTGAYTSKADFDPGIGIYQLNCPGNYYIFISKLDRLGNFVWAKTTTELYPNASLTIGNSIILDKFNNIYTTGMCYGVTDFDPGADSFLIDAYYNAFLYKLDSLGNFLWVKTFGGKEIDKGLSIALDSEGGIYMTGYFEDSCDFDPSNKVKRVKSNGYSDIYISKFDSDGSFLWVHSIGGPNDDYGQSIFIDPFENIFLTGTYTRTVDFDPGDRLAVLPYTLYSGAFINKLRSIPSSKNKVTQVNIYPNPAQTYIIVDLNISDTSEYYIEIFNNVGKLILEKNRLNYTHNFINFEQMSQGLYFLRVINGNKLLIAQKIIKK